MYVCIYVCVQDLMHVYVCMYVCRLVQSVRNLYKRKELSGEVCVFWEGAFGHMKYVAATSKVLRSALDGADGMFHGVHVYQQMYSALFRRDCDAIHEFVREYSGEHSYIHRYIHILNPVTSDPCFLT